MWSKRLFLSETPIFVGTIEFCTWYFVFREHILHIVARIPTFGERLDRCGELLFRKAAADGEPWRGELESLLKEIREHYSGYAADPGEASVYCASGGRSC